jgi:hypothetical protein
VDGRDSGCDGLSDGCRSPRRIWRISLYTNVIRPNISPLRSGRTSCAPGCFGTDVLKLVREVGPLDRLDSLPVDDLGVYRSRVEVGVPKQHRAVVIEFTA